MLGEFFSKKLLCSDYGCFMSEKNTKKDENCGECKSKLHMQEILSGSNDILYKYNFKTDNYDFLSESIVNLTGLSAPQHLGGESQRHIESIHPDDRENFTKFYQSLFDSTICADEVSLEYRVKHLDGHYVWQSDNIRIFKDEKGKVTSVVGNARNITARKQLEHELIQSRKKYEQLYNNSQIAMYRTRISDGKLLECNDMLVKVLGYNNKEQCLAEHHSRGNYANPAQRDLLLAQLKKYNEVNGFVLETKKVDGSQMWIKVWAKIFPEQGFLEGGLVDVTVSKVLTKTERKITQLVMTGMSSREIADNLNRSVRTVEDHRANILKKLSVNNTVELVKRVIACEIAVTPAPE